MTELMKKYYYIKEVDSMSKLANVLLSGYGFLTDETIKDLKDIMGGNFKVVIRTYEHGRLFKTINELENIDEEIDEDIRDVFIDAETYNTLINLMGLN